MFELARLKLTLWYVLMLMTISVSFSLVVYRLQLVQFRDFELQHRLRQEYQFREQLGNTAQCSTISLFGPDLVLMKSAHERLVLMLLSLNGLIFALATGISYVVAGKTLRPIQQILNQQRQFVTDVSHDLKTPLAAMKTELEVSLRDSQLSLTEAKHILQSNLEEVDQLHQLCQRLLHLTAYNRQRTPLKSLVTVDDVIASALKKVKALAAERSIVLKTEPSSLSVFADKQAIVEALVIVLDNAVKYSPTNTTVTISAASSLRMIEITVTDQGQGIPKTELSHIFDRFYRVDKARTQQGNNRGYGLGLAIAQSIVAAHRGTITVKSQEGVGSSFTLKLPK